MRWVFIASALGRTPLVAVGAVAGLLLIILWTWWAAGRQVRHHHGG